MISGPNIGGGAGQVPMSGGVTPGSNLPMNVPLKPYTGSNTPTTTSPDGAEPTEAGNEQSLDALGAYARQCFTQAVNSRTIVDQLLLQNLRQRRGEYGPEELAAIGKATVLTFFNITATKCRAGEAWLTDILTASGDRMWELKPTPLPSVPSYIRDLVVKQVEKEIQKFGMPPEEAARSRINELANTAYSILMKKAQDACDRMQRKIDDQLTECNFLSTMQAFVADLMVYPYAVLKAPVIKKQRRLKWGSGAEPIATTEAVMDVERVSPFDYYFAPWSTSPQEGYVVEVMHMTRQALFDCKGQPNFNDDKLLMALQQYIGGHQELVQTTTQREQLEWQTLYTMDQGDNIDVLDFWGAIRGDLLEQWGVKVEDPMATYEANVWVVGSIAVRAVLNPDPMQQRPYYVTSYEKVPGSMVGRSVPMLMLPNQQIINSAYRALRRNMGLASGPFAEVDQSRLGGQQAPEEIMPAMVKVTEPDLLGSGKPAYHFHNINSHAAELQATIDAEIRKCDDATGIPAYAYGNAQVAGAGRTVGGLAMLMGNSAKGIKKVIVNIEQDVLQPLITAFYNYNMMFDPDPALKADAQVVAKGPTSILARETAAAKRMEALTVLQPFIPTGIIQKEGMMTLLREVLKSADLPIDDIIPDPKLMAEVQMAAGGGGPPPQAQGGGGAPRGVGGGPANPMMPPGLGAPQPPQGPGQVAQVPQAPVQGAGLTPAPDRRSGPAGGVVRQLNSGRV